MENMEELIKEEINKISGLAERVVFKDIVEQIFLSLYETNLKMYSNLEERVMKELSFDINRYRVCNLVAEKKYVDMSHHLLRPIHEEDVKEKFCDLREIMEDFKVQGMSLVKTVFLEGDYLQIEELMKLGKRKGNLVTNRREYPAEFLLKRNVTYLEEITHLYELFVSNAICWKTLNTCYLYKFVDLYLLEDGFTFETGEKLERIEVDWEEYEKMAHENYVPLWNIQKLTLNSVGFPVPCEDHKNFEHVISIKDYGDEHVYLIDDISSIFHLQQQPGRLVVTAKEAEAKKWNIYMIRSGENKKFERFSLPLLDNNRKDSFVEYFWKKQGVQVKTEAELGRLIRGYGLEEYIEFVGFEICNTVPAVKESYSMNSFILDEIRDRDSSKALLLEFKGGLKHPFLHRDMMSFVVSEVQLLYPEYQCFGRLVKQGEV